MTPEQLAEIHRLSLMQTRPWSVREFADLLASPRSHVVTSDNGFAFVLIAGPEAELLTIAVHPHARRNGEGRSLVKKILRIAKVEKWEDIFLEVAFTNTPAIALYQAHGFIDCAKRKHYYNGPGSTKSDALIMYKKL